MFGGNKESVDKKSNHGVSTSLNTISKGTTIEGEINSDSIIRIDGTVKGVVRTKAKLAVGKSGFIDGDIYCQNADIEGKVIGKIYIEDLLFIRTNAQVEGNVSTAKLVVESGAKFNGSCSMGEKGLTNGQKLTPVTKKEAV